MRLRSRRDFARVYRQGRRWRGQGFSLIFHGNGMAYSRMGVSVHRKLRGAVRRNRIKRLFREVFRLRRELFPPEADIVVTVRPDFDLDHRDDVARAVARLDNRTRP